VATDREGGRTRDYTCVYLKLGGELGIIRQRTKKRFGVKKKSRAGGIVLRSKRRAGFDLLTGRRKISKEKARTKPRKKGGPPFLRENTAVIHKKGLGAAAFHALWGKGECYVLLGEEPRTMRGKLSSGHLLPFARPARKGGRGNPMERFEEMMRKKRGSPRNAKGKGTGAVCHSERVEGAGLFRASWEGTCKNQKYAEKTILPTEEERIAGRMLLVRRRE